MDDDVSLTDLLNCAVHVARRCVPGTDWCSITTRVHCVPATAATSGPHAWELDERQYRAGDGPCLRALRSAEPVRMGPAELADTWPELAQAATAHAVRVCFAMPLRTPAPGEAEPRAWGALNLYSGSDAAFGPESMDLVRALAEYLDRGMSDYTARRSAEQQAGQLQRALISRAVIEQAKGILMAAHHISADEAFEILRTRSQDSNVKLHQVAVEFVAAQAAPEPGTSLVW